MMESEKKGYCYLMLQLLGDGSLTGGVLVSLDPRDVHRLVKDEAWRSDQELSDRRTNVSESRQKKSASWADGPSWSLLRVRGVPTFSGDPLSCKENIL